MSGVPPSALAEHAFLQGMPAEYVARLAEVATEVSVPAGHRFFEEGDPADRFWLIRAGRVALDLNVQGGGGFIVETLGEGDVIGLSWLAPHRRWQFGAEAVQPTTAFEFDAVAVTALCESDPVFGYQVIRRLMNVAARRLQATRIRLLDMYGLPSQHADT